MIGTKVPDFDAIADIVEKVTFYVLFTSMHARGLKHVLKAKCFLCVTSGGMRNMPSLVQKYFSHQKHGKRHVSVILNPLAPVYLQTTPQRKQT